MDQDATWNGGIGLSPGRIVLDGDLAPQKGAQQPPLFSPCLWPNGRPSQLLLSSCTKWLRTAFLIMLHTVVVKSRPRHFGTWYGTVRHLVHDSSALRSELSLGHFGTGADLSGQFGPTKLVTKCPGSEVSVIQSQYPSDANTFILKSQKFKMAVTTIKILTRL